MMGHAFHLVRDERWLRELPTVPAWTWPRIGSYLVGRLGPGQLLIGDGIGAYYLQAFGLR